MPWGQSIRECVATYAYAPRNNRYNICIIPSGGDYEKDFVLLKTILSITPSCTVGTFLHAVPQ